MKLVQLTIRGRSLLTESDTTMEEASGCRHNVLTAINAAAISTRVLCELDEDKARVTRPTSITQSRVGARRVYVVQEKLGNGSSVVRGVLSLYHNRSDSAGKAYSIQRHGALPLATEVRVEVTLERGEAELRASYSRLRAIVGRGNGHLSHQDHWHFELTCQDPTVLLHIMLHNDVQIPAFARDAPSISRYDEMACSLPLIRWFSAAARSIRSLVINNGFDDASISLLKHGHHRGRSL